MDITQIIAGDTPWLADIVYPLLAGVCTMVALLALGWYLMPPRNRHPLHLYVSVIATSLVVPALIASAATGISPSYEMSSIRDLLRLSWLVVVCVLLSVVMFYVRRFLCLWVSKSELLSDRLRRWNATIGKVEKEIRHG